MHEAMRKGSTPVRAVGALAGIACVTWDPRRLGWRLRLRRRGCSRHLAVRTTVREPVRADCSSPVPVHHATPDRRAQVATEASHCLPSRGKIKEAACQRDRNEALGQP